MQITPFLKFKNYDNQRLYLKILPMPASATHELLMLLFKAKSLKAGTEFLISVVDTGMLFISVPGGNGGGIGTAVVGNV
ncbi:MAG: hypothetical protein WC483_04090, partial [Candidatus Paceibacterota bacterium]